MLTQFRSYFKNILPNPTDCMPLTSYPTGSEVPLACGPEAVNVNERDGELSGVPLACEPEAAIVNEKDGEVTIGTSARKFWQGKMAVKGPEVETVHPKKNRTIYGLNMLSSGLSAISSLEMFGEESAVEFDDWAERFKDHLTVYGKNFTDQEKVTRFKLCLKDAPRALFKELYPAQTTTLDLAMSALRVKLDSPQRREIAKRTLTLCRQREDESVAQFLRRLTPLIEATNHSLTEAQRKEKVCEEFLDRLKPSMSFLIRLIGLTQAKSLEVVKAQAEELEALLLINNRGDEVSRLSQAVNVINSRPSQPQWSAGLHPGAAGNEQGSSGSNMRSAGPFSASNVQRQPPSFRGARGGSRNWAQGRQEQVSQSNWSGDRQCQYCGRMGHLVYACQERQADFEDSQGRDCGQAEWVNQQPCQPQMEWQNQSNSAEIPLSSTASEGFMEDLVRALVEMNARSNTGRSAPEESSDQRR